MSWLRAPARLGLLVTMALAVVAGIGFAGLEQRATSRRRRRVLIAIIMCYAVARSSVGGLDLVAAPPVTTVSRWLGRLPRGNVAEFPYFSDSSDRHRHTEYMLTSIQHWQPLLNGYSDYIPDDAFADMVTLSTFPDRAAWRVLEARQARYLVIHWNLYEPAERARVRREIQRAPILLRLVEEPDTSLFQLSWRPDVATLVEK
jgi:hypothetical protein